MSAGLGIRAAAIPAWLALHRAIEETGPTPCADDPDRWADPITPAVAEYAAHQCGRCLVLDLCSTFATTNREKTGIYAGKDRTPRRDRPVADTKEKTA